MLVLKRLGRQRRELLSPDALLNVGRSGVINNLTSLACIVLPDRTIEHITLHSLLDPVADMPLRVFFYTFENALTFNTELDVQFARPIRLNLGK